MDRKKFLINSSIAVFALSSFGSVAMNSQGSFSGDCTTTDDILGPFYRPNAPKRNNMLTDGLVGNQITIKGKVFGEDCITPVEGAQVEIWHCNTNGEYDNKSKRFDHRALWISDKKGEYSFKTIMPGKYLNGKLYRPAHIHFRITANNYKELVSQVYFKGDSHIGDDPWASQEKAISRILPFSLEDVSGGLDINFNIFLEKK